MCTPPLKKHLLRTTFAGKYLIVFSILTPSLLNAHSDELFSGNGYYEPSHHSIEHSMISANVVIQESWPRGSGLIQSDLDKLHNHKPLPIQRPISANNPDLPQHRVTEYYTHSKDINEVEREVGTDSAVQLEFEQSFTEEQNKHFNRLDKKNAEAQRNQNKRQAELERERLKREIELARESRKLQQEMRREHEKYWRELEKERWKLERELAKSN